MTVFSQEKTTTHKVKKGETIVQIAQKYNVTPYDIYQLNPDAINGLNPDSVLIIPKTKSKVKATSQIRTHNVLAKETLYSIEKKYEITDLALKKANPFLEKDGLQIGQVLTIPAAATSVSKPAVAEVAIEKPIYHVVLPKETKYSIAKQYGITIEALERKNPDIIANLTIGYRLLIKGSEPKVDEISVKKESTAASEKNGLVTTYTDYEVKPKETLYSLSKLFELSQEELIALNPDLKNGVAIGMVLKVPTKGSMELGAKKEMVTLTKNPTSTSRKKIVLLLPFNVTTIERDTINSTSDRLKKDKFLNMTLDFYSGALVAIDSSKTLGLPIEFTIFDSQETKSSVAVFDETQKRVLEHADAIVGPFYQSNAETIAQQLGNKNIPIISPLSKDIGNGFPTIYQTVPTADNMKTAIFNFMKSKKGNMIAVVDKKKESSRKYLHDNQKEVKLAEVLDNGTLSTTSLKSLFEKDKTNYVILETANTVMIKATIKTMVDAMSDYDVQLVILEANETLDTDEIKFENLVKLKLLYPSINRENGSDAAVIFNNKYRKANYVSPNVFATRGFDVTFDAMMRLVQDKTYQDLADSIATEQVDNRFDFYKREDGGYTNKGIYILYYDSDLTIKEAN
jgi:LysM repeat protein